MTLSEISLRRPVLATVVSLLIIVGGIASLAGIPVRELPQVETAEVTVSVDYSGAAPEVVDAQITTVIEGAVAGISGVESISSESERGSNRTVIEFATGRDIDQAANDVRAAISRVVNQLPDSADQPRVRKNNDQSSPVVWLTLSSDRMTPSELTDYADRYLADRLATVAGVADVHLYGERAFAMRVWLDREAMAAREVTVGDVRAALNDNNVELPAGRIETPGRQFQVRTATRLSTPGDFGRLVVKTVDGYPVLLRDIARIERGVENDNSIFRGNFKTAIGLGVLAQSQSNTVEISAAVRDELDAVRKTLPEGMSLEVANDDAVYIRNSIAEVLKTLAIAVVLVVAVIFAFLASPRATLVPAVTIPIALVGACAGIALFGFSINILTLFALILSIGLVVDDAIVVLENIQRRIEGGEDRLVASALGSRQVTFAVLATSATLIAVFVPISFLQGQVGRLFSEFGIILAIAVAVSTFVALSLTPVLCAALLTDAGHRGLLERLVDRAMRGLNAVYRVALKGALRVPYLVLLVAALIGASSVELYERLPKELTPKEDRGMFFVSVTAPQGANLAYTNRATGEVEEVLRPYLDEGVFSDVVSIIGRWGELRRAFVVVLLAPWDERDRSAQQIVAELRPKLGRITDARAFPIAPSGLGLRGASNPLRVVVGGPDFERVKAWSRTLEERLRQNEGLTNVERDFQENQPGFRITVDRERARDLGIDVRRISEALQTLFASAQVTEYTDRGRQYPVLLQAGDEDRNTPSDLEGVFVRAPDSGELVPLSGLVTLQERASARALNRHDRLPSIEIQAGLADGMDLGKAIGIVRQVAARGAAARGVDQLRRPGEGVSRHLAGRGDRLRARAPDRLPRARGAVRELHPPGRDPALGAARRVGRVPDALPDGHIAQHLQPGRARAARRPRRQERHPDRGVREPAPRRGAQRPRGDRRGLGAAAQADPDDGDLDPARRAAAGHLRGRRRRGAPDDRPRHHRRLRARLVPDAVPDARALRPAGRLFQAPRRDREAPRRRPGSAAPAPGAAAAPSRGIAAGEAADAPSPLRKPAPLGRPPPIRLSAAAAERGRRPR